MTARGACGARASLAFCPDEIQETTSSAIRARNFLALVLANFKSGMDNHFLDSSIINCTRANAVFEIATTQIYSPEV